MWVQHNENPDGKNVGDCTVRAICAATGKPWETIYMETALEGLRQHDMQDANRVWHAVLRRNGFTRHALPDTCTDCYTVRDFCTDHLHGVYVLALPEHVVTCIDGCYLDTWDSGDLYPIYFFCREE